MTTKDDIIKYALHTPENTNPSVLGGLLSDLQEEKSIQPDWNQNDETAADYVKNRPFYTGDPVETVLVEESTASFANSSSGFYIATLPISFNAEFGQTYKVSWDGTSYECVCGNYSNIPLIGNQSILGLGSDTGEPFLIFNDSGLNETGWASATTDTSASHIISISLFAVELVKIDEKYLPMSTDDSYGIVKKSDIVTAYNFPSMAPHDPMVEAITAFKAGGASIVWDARKIIRANYDSSADTISATFADAPLRLYTFSNNNGFYNSTIGSNTYGELQGNSVRILNDDGVYSVLWVEGEPPNVTLKIAATRISINEIYGMSTTEMILKSSTEGSRKNFKITVDDSGTLTVTEYLPQPK